MRQNLYYQPAVWICSCNIHSFPLTPHVKLHYFVQFQSWKSSIYKVVFSQPEWVQTPEQKIECKFSISMPLQIPFVWAWPGLICSVIKARYGAYGIQFTWLGPCIAGQHVDTVWLEAFERVKLHVTPCLFIATSLYASLCFICSLLWDEASQHNLLNFTSTIDFFYCRRNNLGSLLPSIGNNFSDWVSVIFPSHFQATRFCHEHLIF